MGGGTIDGRGPKGWRKPCGGGAGGKMPDRGSLRPCGGRSGPIWWLKALIYWGGPKGDAIAV